MVTSSFAFEVRASLSVQPSHCIYQRSSLSTGPPNRHQSSTHTKTSDVVVPEGSLTFLVGAKTVYDFSSLHMTITQGTSQGRKGLVSNRDIRAHLKQGQSVFRLRCPCSNVQRCG